MQSSKVKARSWVRKIPLGIRVFFFLIYLLILAVLVFGLLIYLFSELIAPEPVATYIFIGLLFALIIYIGITSFKKSNRREKKVLLVAGIFQLSILPLIYPAAGGLETYLLIPDILKKISITDALIALVVVLVLYVTIIIANSILLSVLMGSSKLENAIRKWLTRSWVGRLVKEIDAYLYLNSDVMSLTYEPLRGWRKWLSPFPITLSCLGFYTILQIISSLDSYYPYYSDFPAYLVSGLMLSGVFVHFYSPPLSRKFKYDLILAGLSVIAITSLLNYSYYLTVLISRDFYLYFKPAIVLGFLFFIKKSKSMFKFFLPSEREDVMRRVKRNTLLFIPVVIFVAGDLLQIVLLIYLLFRYHMINWLFERPILYFRSFRSDKDKDNFTDIIGTVAAKYGVVTGLVHSKPHSEEFRKVMRISERARLFMVPNEKWKEWVLSYMKKASAIIIDFEVKTEGVKWEVEKSVEICGEDHVIILDSHFWDEAEKEGGIELQKDRLGEKIELALNYRRKISL